MLAMWGRLVYRRRWLVLALSILPLAASVLALQRGGTLVNAYPSGTEYDRAFKLMQRELPQAGGSSFTLVFGSTSLTVPDPRFRRMMQAALAPLRHDPRVSAVQTPYDAPVPRALVSRDGKHALAIVALREEFNVARSYYRQLRAMVHSGGLHVLATDPLATANDYDRLGEADLQRAEQISLPLSLLLLVLVFASIVAALLPLGVGVLAVVGGLAGAFLLTRVTDVTQYALNIVTLIGLGVAIDYSLFIVNRFQEELAGGATVEDGVAQALATAGRAIAFSSLTAAIGLCGLLFYRGSFLASMGMAGAIVVGLAAFYALTFLPALLAVLGPRVYRLHVPLRRARPGRGLWRRIATAVMRHPLVALGLALAVVLLAGSPFLHIRLADSDVTTLPHTAESRRGYDLLLAQFGPDQTRIVVVVYSPRGRPLSADRVGLLYDLSRKIARLPNVARVDGPLDLDPRLGRADYQALYAKPRQALPAPMLDAIGQSVGQHIVVLTVRTARPPESDAARAIVRAIRAEHVTAGMQVLVTGLTAFDLDFISFILQRTPAAIGFVMAVTYLLLLLLTGSVLLPLKAVIMNLLSISASFGALVWIFQQGHLSAQLHFTAAPVDPTLPVMLFCITFGLSMDYEVLLVSRIQEEYQRTHDNRRAVAEGLERSGRLITGAAAIMIVVFASFASADVLIVKAVGLGLAVAIAIDATIVRALIVPATMCLLGDRNWWAPRPLAPLQRRSWLRGAPVVVARDG